MPRRAVGLQRGAKTGTCCSGARTGSGDSDFRYPRYMTHRTSPATQTLPQGQVRITSRPRFCCSPLVVCYRRTPNTHYRTLGAADVAAGGRTTLAANHQAVTRLTAGASTQTSRQHQVRLMTWPLYSPFFPQTCRFAAACCRPPTRSQDRHMLFRSQDGKWGLGFPLFQICDAPHKPCYTSTSATAGTDYFTP